MPTNIEHQIANIKYLTCLHFDGQRNTQLVDSIGVLVLKAPARQGNFGLAEAFSLALVERDPDATLDQMNSAREKAFRAPLLMLAIARLGPARSEIPALERMVSMGCAIQNILLAAHSLGFGSGLTSGQAMESPHLRSLFAVTDGEFPVCFINIGTVSHRKAASPPRPDPADFTTSL